MTIPKSVARGVFLREIIETPVLAVGGGERVVAGRRSVQLFPVKGKTHRFAKILMKDEGTGTGLVTAVG